MAEITRIIKQVPGKQGPAGASTAEAIAAAAVAVEASESAVLSAESAAESAGMFDTEIGTATQAALDALDVSKLDFRSLQSFGAVGDGVADDTAAVQRALNAGVPLDVYGDFKLSAKLTAENSVTLRGRGWTASKFWWTVGAASRGLEILTDDRKALQVITDISFQNDAEGGGVGLVINNNGIGTTSSVPKPQCYIMRNDFRGRTDRVKWWDVGLEIISPLDVYVEGNNVLGGWIINLLNLEAIKGIYIHKGDYESPGSIHVHKNSAFICQTGCHIEDCEGHWITDNDFQACDYSLICENPAAGSSRRTQVRIHNNHLGATYTPLQITGVNHYKITDNELFRMDTDPSAASRIINIKNSAFGVVNGNTFRNRNVASDTDGLVFEYATGQIGVCTIDSNVFFQCFDQIVIPAQAGLSNNGRIVIGKANIYHNPQGVTPRRNFGGNVGVSTDANTTPKTLASHTVVANSFDSEVGIRVRARGIFANTTTVKTVDLKFGGTTIANLAGTIKDGIWEIESRISFLSSNTQRWESKILRTPTTTEVQPGTDNTTNATVATSHATPVITRLSRGNASEIDTADIIIALVGTNGTANLGDINCTYFRVDYEQND